MILYEAVFQKRENKIDNSHDRLDFDVGNLNKIF